MGYQGPHEKDLCPPKIKKIELDCSKCLKLPANVELAQAVACRALKSDILSSIPSMGNILLLDFFYFSGNSVEFHRICLHSGKTQLF